MENNDNINYSFFIYIHFLLQNIVDRYAFDNNWENQNLWKVVRYKTNWLSKKLFIPKLLFNYYFYPKTQFWKKKMNK